MDLTPHDEGIGGVHIADLVDQQRRLVNELNERKRRRLANSYRAGGQPHPPQHPYNPRQRSQFPHASSMPAMHNAAFGMEGFGRRRPGVRPQLMPHEFDSPQQRFPPRPGLGAPASFPPQHAPHRPQHVEGAVIHPPGQRNIANRGVVLHGARSAGTGVEGDLVTKSAKRSRERQLVVDPCSVREVVRSLRGENDRNGRDGHAPKRQIGAVIRNDYMQNFINSGQRPQNYIRDSPIVDRFEEYPKLRELAKLKDEMTRKRATPPQYLKADLKSFNLASLGTQFDVILVDPPLPEYVRRSPSAINHPQYVGDKEWSWDDIQNLRINEIAATPSFVFMWIGNAEGLDRGREILAEWGYRRCEDIVWIKTNKTWQGKRAMEDMSVLLHTKEHCLMGIKGTVRRSTDGHFIHCNVDTDVIIAEEPPFDSLEKPEELYYIIEHFCLGRRRLELFGQDNNIRPGWLTVGTGISSSNFNPETYASYFASPGGHLVGSTPQIEMLRPKSPPPTKRANKGGGVVMHGAVLNVPNMMMGSHGVSGWMG